MKRKKAKRRFPKKENNYPEMNIHPNIYSLLRCTEQESTSVYIKEVLKNNNITYYEDIYGNIYNLDLKNVPLLSAHMDTVMRADDKEMTKNILPDNTGIIMNGSIIGGDDKCGVYIILRILLSHLKANFIFSADEEVGCLGIQGLLEGEGIPDKIKNNCLYCLVLDRKGDSDIICSRNDYGTEEFENALVKVSENHDLEYKPQIGLFSDADYISDFISTANLSVGYFNPHTKSEIIDMMSLENALFFTERIIEEISEKFEAPNKNYSPSEYNYWRSYSNRVKNKPKYDGYFNKEDEYYFQDEYEEKEECDSCGGALRGEEDLVIVYLENGTDMRLCAECALRLDEQLRKVIGKYF